MRIYVPATVNELELIRDSKIDLLSRRAHAATAALVSEYAAEDITDLEEVEYGAFLAAADDSLMLIAQDPSVAWRRLVISVDVPDSAVTAAPHTSTDEISSSAVDLLEPVNGARVACFHIDETEAAQDIQGVFAGDEAAIVALNDRDLLWFDVSEVAAALN